jgi:uncharacterized cupredoxin-like copper-binding protein
VQRLLVLVSLIPAFAIFGLTGAAEEATPNTGACTAPTLTSSTPASSPSPASEQAGVPASPEGSPAPTADAATSARILAGIENLIACRNAGDYEAYAALLTPNRVLAEVGTSDPRDVVSDLQAFNLPITILSLGDVREHSDGRLSAEFVHLFGPHLYYRSRLYVVEEDGYVKFDEERYLPEEPPDERSTVDVRLTDFAFELSQNTIANARYVVLRGQNDGDVPHEIIVVRLPAGSTVEEALTGAVSEEQIEFVGQTSLAPGQDDDLVLVNLEPGAYTLLCFIDEPGGVPHAARGMVAQLTIEGTAAPTP